MGIIDSMWRDPSGYNWNPLYDQPPFEYCGKMITPVGRWNPAGNYMEYGYAYDGMVWSDPGSIPCDDTSSKPPEPGPKPEPPSEPSGDKGGGEGGGGDWNWDWSRQGGGDWSGGGSGTPGGAGTAEQTTSTSSGEAQSSQPAQPAVPDWMQKRMEYWDDMQKGLLDFAAEAYGWSVTKFAEAWSALGTQSTKAATDLAKKYGQGLGVLAQGQSQQQSALARYAATGRMSGGAAEQAMTSAARETAKGAMGEYQSYAGARAGLADSAMRAYTALGQEASTYTKMVLDAMQSIPNPYQDWANFMAGLSGFSAVAVS